ncbi:SGNH/GDSL hydrolase family protein [Mucilaginibacter sp. Bleaf8]|uniref:SGNH/GDSL hydrolase family protein n=1 Tax=Mucilaginibacter sp. Bleaf8 TaxID=2834430 RepID=UPI001BCC101D|nr:SGNH/GDSL hydrolase family protein [Mucilaginibacter sp. Bleaf8]MBS7563624.1 SGNH/GDSL hydrolase family protein [Mucilaginibacter sp. Bleaf8]
MSNSLNRRKFITGTAVATIGAISLPQIVSAAFEAEKTPKVTLNANDVIVYQGDSITDWGRNKSETTPNSFGMLGTGYVYQSAAHLLLKHADKNLQIYNRGVGGNKVYQLADRWDADCLAFKPNVLSIMVGVNDYWHTLSGNYKGTIETYRTDYKKLLDRTKQALPNVKLIIGEPFAIKDVKAVTDKWYPAFDEYRQAAREIATQYDAIFLPYQKLFDEALKVAPGTYWTNDGVHPSVAGAALMAKAWLKAVKS